MTSRLVGNPALSDWWRHDTGTSTDWGRCWVCGLATRWIYLDLGYQHPECDAYPSTEGRVRVIDGVAVTEPW